MPKVDATIIKETKYIAFIVAVLSVLMQAVFFVLRIWDYTVVLGNILSDVVVVVNFLLMGITIQKALKKDASDAKKTMKASQSLRNFGVFIVIGVGVLLPWFNTVATIIPIFFPRIAISLRPLLKEKDGKEVIHE